MAISKNFPEKSFSERFSNKFDENLLQLLRCPQSKSELIYDIKAQELISMKSRLAYKIINGIPVMITKKARKI